MDASELTSLPRAAGCRHRDPGWVGRLFDAAGITDGVAGRIGPVGAPGESGCSR